MSKYADIDSVDRLIHGISAALQSVLFDKEKTPKSEKVLCVEDVNGLIKRYSYKNAIISGGIGLIPGPIGMVAAVPEIIAIIKNQMKMVADIAKIYGKEINKELVLQILFGAAANTTIGVVMASGQNMFAKKAGARVGKMTIEIFSKNILKHLTKSMSAKWLPIVGAVAMATWAKYMTSKIGKRAKEIFSKT